MTTETTEAVEYTEVEQLNRLVQQLREQVYQLTGELARQELRFEGWKERATQKLHDEANKRGYCSELDDVMEDLGLARRDRDWEVSVTVSYSTTITVSAYNEQGARDALDLSDLRESVRESLRYDDLDEVEITEVEPSE